MVSNTDYRRRYAVRQVAAADTTNAGVDSFTTARSGAHFVLNDIPFDVTDLDGAITGIHRLARSGTGGHVHFSNAYTLACASKDRSLHQILRSSSMNLADGASVVMASRVLRRPLPQRVAGPDVMSSMLMSDSLRRHYFLGSTSGTLTALIRRIQAKNPGIRIVGHESPPFRRLSAQEYRDQVDRIRDARPDIIWVGLGTPKQEYEAARIAADFPAVTVAVGAAFDFLAETKSRAPEWVRRAGLEWVYRLAQEPRRMWRRYLVGNVRFLGMVMGQLGANSKRNPRAH